ncbi:MAG: toll/interleukin-1 receptor domain-containing protein [Gammaproteobacteria bacterium]|nr:toll/interleukin-1 receptor domain-containing protein [Gammaproteobacteria bacterium]
MTDTENEGKGKGLPESTFRYKAFISYRHVEPDRKWAKWLHTRLETYRIPKQLLAAGDTNRLERVFRDEEELAASSDLSREIDSALAQSEFLIVICSPQTPESRWVNQEIVRFRELGRHDRILALLVKGEPQNAFPDALREIRSDLMGRSLLDRTESVQVEPLAADVRAIAGESERTAKRMAFLRIVSTLLHRRFDDLRQRDQERETRRLLKISVALLFLLVGMGLLALFALFQKQAADHQRDIAEARMLVTQGEADFERDPLIGLRIAAEGLVRAPAGEEDLVKSLSERVARKAAEGRIRKISSNIDKLYHGLPGFPYLLLSNLYSPGTLLHAPDLKPVADINNLATKNSLKLSPSSEYFVLTIDDDDTSHIFRRTADGRSIGRTNSLSDKTLIPERNPIYFLRDIGFSPLLNRISDSTGMGREGFDIREVAYQQGAQAFVLFYRDDDGGEIPPPPPDLFDLQSGAVLQTLPRETSRVFFSGNGSPYFVLVLGDSHWQLRRTDAPGEAIVKSRGSPHMVSFGGDMSSDFWLIGFRDGTELRRTGDGAVIDRMDDSLVEAFPAADEISWTVRMSKDSKMHMLRVVNDRLIPTAPAGDPGGIKTDPAFVPVASAVPINKSLRDRPVRHRAALNEGVYRVTEKDRKQRRSVWRRGKRGPVYFEDEEPEDLAFLYIRRFYNHRSRDDDSLIRSELRRRSDDSPVFGRNDDILRYGVNPSREYVWVQVEDSDEEESEVALVRFADGEVIWEGGGRWISFAPYPSAGYFFVRSVSSQNQLRNLTDGTSIKSFEGRLRHLDFLTLTRDRIFVAAFDDGRYELWDGAGSPALLRNLGFGLRGYLPLPNGLLLIWYENGNAYVIDPAWLVHISRNPDGLMPAELLDSLCSGLFAKPWFDLRTWDSRRPDYAKTCVP